METVLEQREKTLSEIAHDVYTETGSYFAVASIFCFLFSETKSFKSKKGLFDFFGFGLDFSRIYFTNHLNKISLKSRANVFPLNSSTNVICDNPKLA